LPVDPGELLLLEGESDTCRSSRHEFRHPSPRHGVTVGSGEEQVSVGVMFELAVFSKASESGLSVISI